MSGRQWFRAGDSTLKVCPFCYTVALEGEVVCSRCDATPDGWTHDCDHWRAEGVGCSECNPIARAVSRDMGRDALTNALRRIAGLGMDCPTAIERADFYRDQLQAAIGLAARALHPERAAAQTTTEEANGE